MKEAYTVKAEHPTQLKDINGKVDQLIFEA